MGINKICPKILPFVKIRNKNDLPCVSAVFFTVCSLLEAFGSRFGDFYISSCTANK